MKCSTLKSLFFFCVWLFITVSRTDAQIITGTLKNAKGVPLSRVLIEKNRGQAMARTDNKGAFSIAAQPGDTLLIHYGKRPFEVIVGDQQILNLTTKGRNIRNTTSGISEKKIDMGYGVQPLHTLSTAATLLETEDFNYGNIDNPLQLIQGRAPGLLVSRPGDDPSGHFDLQQRGLHTLLGDAQPLVVIDGFPGVSLTTIDPQDIASISLLRDAAAASVYGPRAANGVLLINTKAAGDTEGKLKMAFHTYTGFQQVANTPDVLNAETYVALRGRVDIPNSANIDNWGSSTDWRDAITRKGLIHYSNVRGDWSKAGTSIRTSLNLRGTGDIVPAAGFSQINGSINFGQKLFKDRLNIRLLAAANYRNFRQARPDLFFHAAQFNPSAPVRRSDGTQEPFGDYFQEQRFNYFNPVAILEQTEHGGNLQTYTANLYANWDVWKGLRIGGRVAWQSDESTEGFYAPRESFYRGFNDDGFADYKHNTEDNRVAEAMIGYDFVTGKHRFIIDVGHAYQYIKRNRERFQLTGYSAGDFNYEDLSPDDGNGAINVSNKGLGIRLAAFRGQMNYQYNDQFFLSANARYEGCSRFGINRKWGLFYGIGAGFDFAKLWINNRIDQLKVRVSYGLSGNLPADDILSGVLFEQGGTFFFNGEFIPYYSAVTAPNPDLRWESRRDFNAGVDFSFSDGRFRGTVDHYQSHSEGLLFNYLNITSPVGFTVITENYAAIKNTGIELSFQTELMNKGDWSWLLDLNFGANRTEYANLTAPGQPAFEPVRVGFLASSGSNQAIRIAEGGRVGELFGFEFEGAQNGFPVFGDETVLGNALPAYFWGIGSTLTWKKFEFGLRLRAVEGHSLANETQFSLGLKGGAPRHNILSEALESPATSISQEFTPFSGLFVQDASFVRLDNLRLGYRFDLGNNRYLSSLQVYVAAQNLMTLSGYNGPDPEVRLRGQSTFAPGPDLTIPGIDSRTTHWPVRSWILGVNVAF